LAETAPAPPSSVLATPPISASSLGQHDEHIRSSSARPACASTSARHARVPRRSARDRARAPRPRPALHAARAGLPDLRLRRRLRRPHPLRRPRRQPARHLPRHGLHRREQAHRSRRRASARRRTSTRSGTTTWCSG
jgi:hypothetical protein